MHRAAKGTSKKNSKTTFAHPSRHGPVAPHLILVLVELFAAVADHAARLGAHHRAHDDALVVVGAPHVGALALDGALRHRARRAGRPLQVCRKRATSGQACTVCVMTCAVRMLIKRKVM